MVSWRFLLPGQNRAVRLQRKLFLSAFPRLPRWQWALLCLYNWLTWVLFFAWKMSYHRLRGRKTAYQTYPCPLPLWRQVIDLLSLIIPHGIPPRYYYMYGLWRKPRSSLPYYIYSNTAENWHPVFASNASRDTIDLLWNKHDFSERMASRGVPTVPTLELLPKGKPVRSRQLFRKQSLFLKPVSARYKVGCMELHYDPGNCHYTLLNKRVERREDEASILAELVGGRLQTYDYLMQPLLENHPDISSLTDSMELVTLRFVCGILDGCPEAMFAMLEVPHHGGVRGCLCMNIDLTSGRLFSCHPNQTGDYREFIDRLEGKTLPFWLESMEVCLRAHALVPDLAVAGWDVAITPEGVRLLEGNLKWDVEKHQWVMDQPALATPLIDAYGV